MQTETITLDAATPGLSFQITALVFGPETGKKVYMQASLHGDELPGSLVAYYLHQQLLSLEAQGRLKAQIVLVPLCNPIGLSQMLDYASIGRFHLLTGQNFNRLHNIPLYTQVKRAIDQESPKWSSSPTENTQIIRAFIRKYLQNTRPESLMDAMHLALLKWSYDADLVLDLHCDYEAIMHFYTLPKSWPLFEPLACYLGSECQILSADSGTSSFDEVLSTIWDRLQGDYPEVPIEQACHSATVEFRGERDLCHDLSKQDSQAILSYLHQQAYIELATDQVPEPPPLLNPPNPLSGMCYVKAPISGIVVYLVKPGDHVIEGQPVVDLMNPITLDHLTIKSPARGVVYALGGQRIARPERSLLSISSPDPRGHTGLSP